MRLIILLIVFLLTISNPQKTQAQQLHADSSAKLTKAAIYTAVYGNNHTLEKVMALEKVFKRYNSPLSVYSYNYVKYADKYNVDWKLLPAISGLESSFGRYYIDGTYNAYGWGGGYIYFKSWEDGIEKINASLRKNYYDKGADNVHKIGPIYAEANHWSYSVDKFMQEIDSEYKKMLTGKIIPSI